MVGPARAGDDRRRRRRRGRSTSRSASRSSRWSSRTSARERRPARAGRRRRGDAALDLARDLSRSCSSSSARTARRSCSSTAAAPPNGSRCGSTSSPARDSATPGEAAPLEIARAHHGSLAREERTTIEELLKAGELPCLVATSSLELGIDMGAVDLVIQVESPKSVARGLQRIGRSGHGVGATSKGRIFPKFRADLLECAVVVRRMREGEIEPTVVPRNALDVLAQQIVAIAASAGGHLGRRALRARHAHPLLLRAAPRAARERARHARRPLPVGRVRRAAPADHLGPPRGHDPRAQGRAQARRRQRRDDPRPRPLFA